MKHRKHHARNSPNEDLHPDPITGAPGFHPLATGIGTAGGAVAGAAIGGLAAGPPGMAAGGVVGGVIGGLTGKVTALALDSESETAYWQDQYKNEPYYDEGFGFADYLEAFNLAWTHYDPGISFESIERELSDDWDSKQHSVTLPWELAREAARASWERLGLRMTHPRNE